jgi:hypothetical protein
MLGRVISDATDYWTALRGLAAAPADKYALAHALGATVEAWAYAAEAGIAITETFHTDQGTLATTETPIEDLKAGDRYVGDDGRSVYEVTDEAASHQRRWVYVRELGVNPTARRPDGSLAAEGFLTFPPGTPMRRVHQANAAGDPASAPPRRAWPGRGQPGGPRSPRVRTLGRKRPLATRAVSYPSAMMGDRCPGVGGRSAVGKGGFGGGVDKWRVR